MDPQLITTLILGFTLGLKHALDPDHVVAVSTIVASERSLLRSAAVGLSWGLGHTLTLLVVGLAVLFLQVSIPEGIATLMELAVGVMLVVLGWQSLRAYRKRRLHAHPHQHPGAEAHFHLHPQQASEAEHTHAHPSPESRSFWAGFFHDFRLRPKSLLVGMIHGLAGSAALLLLVLTTARSAVQGLAYILLFGLGSIGGMLMVSSLMGLPLAISAERFSWLNEKVGLAAGVVSIGLGAVLIAHIYLPGA
ncbi:MAG: urease accessory protein UreH [Chloroflexi bacterium]|nr:urease accessory protein UreH [Chloroflexota bacterium]